MLTVHTHQAVLLSLHSTVNGPTGVDIEDDIVGVTLIEHIGSTFLQFSEHSPTVRKGKFAPSGHSSHW